MRQQSSLMRKEHNAKIYWSPEQVTRGLPAMARAVNPAWFTEPGRGSDEGWSLVCEFPTSPVEQGVPTVARVRFLVEEAPHDRLRPGTVLRLFEPGTGQRARVEILE